MRGEKNCSFTPSMIPFRRHIWKKWESMEYSPIFQARWEDGFPTRVQEAKVQGIDWNKIVNLNQAPFLAVIIPTWQEERTIESVLDDLARIPEIAEICVVDGGSSDQTVLKAERKGARVVTSPRRGRGFQMQAGVEQTKSPV